MSRHSAPDAEEPVEIEVSYAPAAPATPAPASGPVFAPPIDPPTGALDGPAVHGDRLRYVRAGRVVLDAVTVDARPGEVLAVIGPSGSGKSSLLALLAGLERPDGGSVAYDDRPLTGVRPGVGLILQGYGLVGVLTASENVEVVLQARRPRRSRAEVRAQARQALAEVGLADVGDHLVDQLSGGQQQRVAIARALVIDPSTLFADELTAELDHASKLHVLGLLLERARRGATVVVATHDADVYERCDRIVRLIDGRLVTH